MLIQNALADNTPRAVPADTAVAPTGAAQTTAATPSATNGLFGGGSAEKPGILGMVLPFAVMFAVLYFLMIRPQQKKMKEQQNLMGSLKQGDEVLTSSGLLGKITGVTDKVVTLEIADNVRVKILKSQIAQVVKGPIKDLVQ